MFTPFLPHHPCPIRFVHFHVCHFVCFSSPDIFILWHFFIDHVVHIRFSFISTTDHFFVFSVSLFSLIHFRLIAFTLLDTLWIFSHFFIFFFSSTLRSMFSNIFVIHRLRFFLLTSYTCNQIWTASVYDLSSFSHLHFRPVFQFPCLVCVCVCLSVCIFLTLYNSIIIMIFHFPSGFCFITFFCLQIFDYLPHFHRLIAFASFIGHSLTQTLRCHSSSFVARSDVLIQFLPNFQLLFRIMTSTSITLHLALFRSFHCFRQWFYFTSHTHLIFSYFSHSYVHISHWIHIIFWFHFFSDVFLFFFFLCFSSTKFAFDLLPFTFFFCLILRLVSTYQMSFAWCSSSSTTRFCPFFFFFRPTTRRICSTSFFFVSKPIVWFVRSLTRPKPN